MLHIENSLWVQCGKRSGGCRRRSRSLVDPGRKENAGLAKAVALKGKALDAAERVWEVIATWACS